MVGLGDDRPVRRAALGSTDRFDPGRLGDRGHRPPRHEPLDLRQRRQRTCRCDDAQERHDDGHARWRRRDGRGCDRRAAGVGRNTVIPGAGVGRASSVGAAPVRAAAVSHPPKAREAAAQVDCVPTSLVASAVHGSVEPFRRTNTMR